MHHFHSLVISFTNLEMYFLSGYPGDYNLKYNFKNHFLTNTNLISNLLKNIFHLQPELTENLMARKSNTKEIKNKHSSRPVGGVEMGSRGGEDSSCHGGTETGRVWDEQAVCSLAGSLLGGRQSDH